MSDHITIKDIANALNLSPMTVSRALRGLSNVDKNTRERVVETAERMGYTTNRIAKSLKTKRTNTIGVVVPEIINTFQPEVIRGIEDVTYDKGYELLLTQSGENSEREEKSIRTLESHRVDGILISTTESGSNIGEYRRLVDSGIPFVFYDRYISGIGASIIRIDDKKFALQITKHLVEHGYERIGAIRGPRGLSVSEDRYLGFREALEQAGMPIHRELVVEGGFRESGGYQAMKSILSLNETHWPDAMFAANDPAAFGAMQASEEAGLNVPTDIAIVGFSNDIRSKFIRPKLTTVDPKPYLQGNMAVTKLIKIIEKKNHKPEDILIEAELVIRESCGCQLK